MRLRRLDLARYGRFERASLDFGAAGEGPDVTVIFGPNEAGKSTAFAAWLDLLYGFQRQGHPYAFRFERKDLLVGAEVETAEGPLVLQRTARNIGSLTDGSGREVAEHRLAALLHGLDRDAYRTRFSLNDGVLRSGGEEIAAARAISAVSSMPARAGFPACRARWTRSGRMLSASTRRAAARRCFRPPSVGSRSWRRRCVNGGSRRHASTTKRRSLIRPDVPD